MKRAYMRLRGVEVVIRGAAIRLMIRLGGGQCGPGLTAERGATLHRAAHAGIHLGSGIHLGRGCILHISPGADLVVGDNCNFMHFSVIACQGRMSIGSNTQVAEHCSVRDAEHGTGRQDHMRRQEAIGEVRIGQDVWIGRGSAVLMGAVIGDGAVVGANSLVKGEIPPFGIAVGAPARVVRYR